MPKYVPSKNAKYRVFLDDVEVMFATEADTCEGYVILADLPLRTDENGELVESVRHGVVRVEEIYD